MKNIRFLLQVLGLSVIIVGCMGGEPQNGQTRDEVNFLRQKASDAPQMAALLEGELVIANGCLRIQSSDGEGFTAIWPFEFGVNQQNSSVDILNGKGQVVAQVGDYLRVSGGGGDLNTSQEEFAEHYLGLYRCSEPHWIVNSDVEVTTP